MRETYWSFYYKIVYQFFYYKRFQILFSTINRGISSFCCLMSLARVAAWSMWKTYPLLWSILICVAQLIQALSPKLPYNDLLHSTRFMICSFDKLLLSIRHTWFEMDVYDYTDEQILKFTKKYDAQYSELVSQFFSGSYLPEIQYCNKRAEKEAISYFNINHPSWKEINLMSKTSKPPLPPGERIRHDGGGAPAPKGPVPVPCPPKKTKK